MAAIQAVIAVTAVLYILWPPTDSPVNFDSACLAIALALVAFTLWMAPTLPWWATDSDVAATWGLVIALTLTRVTGQGQLILGLVLLALAVWVTYFLPLRRAVPQVAAMIVAYVVALLLNEHLLVGFFVVLVPLTLLSTAVILGDLRQNDRHFRLLVDNASDVVFHSEGGLIRWISPSVEAMLGWKADELVGTSIHRLWHSEDYDAAVGLRDGAYAGTLGMGVFRMLTRRGDYVWVEITFKPYPSRRRPGAVGSMRDVSTRIAAEEALVEAAAHAQMSAEMESRRARDIEVLEAAKSALFHDVSHELRTPLTIIQGPLRGVLRDPSLELSASQRTDLQAAERAASGLTDLVDNLLDVARGRAGQLAPKSEPVDLADLIRQVSALFGPRAHAAGVELTVSTAGMPQLLDTDPDMWVKIVMNLVSNAVKFTASGQIAVSVRHDGTHALLTVADSGIGISPGAVGQVFERFQQGGGRTQHGESGSGLGLSVVAELARSAGGTVEVHSELALGSMFTVRIPCTRTAATRDGEATPVIPVLLGPSPAVTDHGAVSYSDEPIIAHGVRGRVLIVEDDRELRAYIARLLANAGLAVTAVRDAEAANGLVADHDLLLADITLPGKSGLDLLRQVRAHPHHRWTPTILLTARSDRDAIVEGLSAGADDYVTKPFDPDELLARVNSHVELALMRRFALDEAGDRVAALEKALTSNRIIGTAVGVVMAEQKITPEAAFRAIRAHSQRTNCPMRDVADDVIRTGALETDVGRQPRAAGREG